MGSLNRNNTISMIPTIASFQSEVLRFFIIDSHK
jgi:hypothetical protein